MCRGLLGSSVDLGRTSSKGTDMQNWKLDTLPIVMLRGWDYDGSPPRGKAVPKRSVRRAVRRRVTAVGGLLSATSRTTSR
jgi:hypothetical protein